MQSDLNHSNPGLQHHRSLSPRLSSFFQRNPLFPSFSPHQERTLIYCPMNPGPPTAPRPHADVHRDNPKSQIDHHQNPNRNLHVSLSDMLLHKSKPKPIDWLCWRHIRDVGGGYGFAGMREIFALVDWVHAGTRLAMFDIENFNFKLLDVNTKNLVERGYKTYKWSDFLNTQIEKKKRFSCQWSSWVKESNLWTMMALQTRKTRIRLQTQMDSTPKMGLNIDNEKMRRLYTDLRFRFGRFQLFWY